MRFKSKKFTGVYYETLQDNDKSYYITYTNHNKKFWTKIGLHSQGVREAYCNQIRNSTLLKLRLGENSKIILKNKIKYTINKIFSDFLAHKSYSKKTYTTFNGRYTHHIKPIFENKIIDEITELEIITLYNQKLQTHSLKTASLIISLLNSIIKFAIEQKVFNGENPCRNIKIKKADNQRLRYLSKEEILRLLDELTYDKELELFTIIALTTGARLHSIMQLQNKDFNLQTKTITIKDNKSNTTYHAFITQELESKLKINPIKPNEKIIKKTERTLQRNIQNVLNKLFNQDLEKRDSKNRVVIHTFRHTFASLLVIGGTPIFTVQKLLNHKDIEHTKRYAKLNEDSGRSEVNNILKMI